MSMENPGEEVNELHEQAEKAEHTKMIEVSFTMSVLAVVLAAATLLGHRAHTEEVLLSNDRSDQWNFYQFKKLRGTQAEQVVDNLTVLQADITNEKTRGDFEKIKEKYAKRAEKETEDIEKISEKAKDLEAERELMSRRADRYDLSEGFFEVALVICSLALLTSKRIFWFGGMAIGIAGVIVIAMGLMIR